jgi:predicted ribosome quality control (RQC) complex YloA/Tae2 family protein
MSSLDVSAMVSELQGLVGYRIDNVYRNETDTFFLIKLKGKGYYKKPMLLVEPGIRIHLTELKHSIPERPSDKILALRKHLKGSEVTEIQQIDFDRVVRIKLRGKQQYHVYIELFGNRPNFVVVGEQNQIIFALWYRKMRHRDLLPGKEFKLPPVRGKSILKMSHSEIKALIDSDVNEDGEIVRILARRSGGGGELMEEILFRAGIAKEKNNKELVDEEINSIVNAVQEIKKDLHSLKPFVLLEKDESLKSFHPIAHNSQSGDLNIFETFSMALDFYFENISSRNSIGLIKYNKRRKKLLKVLEAQEKTVEEYVKKKKQYQEIGDKVYRYYDAIDELLSTILNARKNNTTWHEIKQKLTYAKEKGIKSAQLLERINSERSTIEINLDSEIIEVDFHKSASKIANDFYGRAKKAARKIDPAKIAIAETKNTIDSLNQDIKEQSISESVSLKRRKRKWYEKYHWTWTKSGFLVIAGKDISSNEEIVKRRMTDRDLFFHADLSGAPYTILKNESSDKEVTEEEITTAAHLAAVFSSAWKAGYGSVDVYYVTASQVSFTPPSGEYIPKGGIMVRGSRKYLRGIEISLSIGVQIEEHNATVIYGREDEIRAWSPFFVVIKPGSVSKGKIAKQIREIFVKKASSAEDRAKLQGIDLNEFVRAIPHSSVVSRVENKTHI